MFAALYRDQNPTGNDSTGVRLGINIPLDSDFRPVMGRSTSVVPYGSAAATPPTTPTSPTPQLSFTNMIDFVRDRGYMPTTIATKIDPTATPRLLVEIDKTILPAGSSIDTVTGITTIALPGTPGALIGAINTSNGVNVMAAFSLV